MSVQVPKSLWGELKVWLLPARRSMRVGAAFSVLMVMASAGAAQDRPYGGTAWPIPGSIQAEDFNEGGQGVAYYDNSLGNAGGYYRSTDVDIARTATGGYALGWVAAGEWLKYTVNVSAAGNYRIVLRVASAGLGGTFHIEFNDVNKTGALRVPNTGGWSTYQDLPVTVALEQGVQTMRIVFDENGASTGAVGNLSFLSLTTTSASVPLPSTGVTATPFGGSAWAIPGTVQAEDFDQGGEGVSYRDNTSGNAGGAYRTTNVDIASTPDGYTVGWIGAGEWLQYTVNIGAAGTYTLVTRVASPGSGGTFHIEFNGVNKTGSLRVPNTGSWGTYQDLAATVSLSAGVQTMRVVFESVGSTTGAVGNVSYFRFAAVGSGSATTGPTPYGGTARGIPGTVEAEDFDQGGAGVAYRDTTAGNTGGAYRTSDVDIQSTPSGGFAVGWTAAGEWLRYTVNVGTAGAYTLVARVASNGTGGTFHVEFEGENKTGTLRIPHTGGWTTYVDVSVPVSLAAGLQTMTVVFDSVGSSGAVGNLHYVRLASGAPAPPPPPPSTGQLLRVMTWNIKMDATDIAGQARVMADSGADVMLLQEATLYREHLPTTLPQRLQQLTGQTWYSLWAPHSGRYSTNEGTLIVSRLPPLNTTTMTAYDRGFARMLVSVGGVQVNVFSLHLDWYSTTARTAQLEEFLAWSRTFAGPRVAGADMNSWWGEYWIARMETEYIDTWQEVTGSEENGYTLNGAVRFDYLFRSRTDAARLTPSGCWVTTTTTSDHWPVIADYIVR